MALRSEVHLPDDWFEGGGETAGRVHVRTLSFGLVPISIEIAATVTDELVAAFDALIPQLSSSSPPPGAAELGEIVESPTSVLFVARVDGRIVGALTLATYRIPTGLKAWIEEALSRAAIDEAIRRGAKDVNLSSRPSRTAANRLYQRIGFELRNTNTYRFKP
jgi:ribosomal protein S18 acetylase RimI-like enzyme